MRYLAINTADRLEILLKNGESVQYYCADDKTLASVELLSRIDQMMCAEQLKPSDMDFFAAVTGAGSFTGIRIGVTTINALCFALDKPCCGVSTFDYVAQGQTQPLSVVINGTGGVCYIKNFPPSSNVPAAMCIKNESVMQLAYKRIIAATDFLEENERVEVFCPSAEVFSAAVEAEYLRNKDKKEPLQPIYLRRSQAERTGDEL